MGADAIDLAIAAVAGSLLVAGEYVSRRINARQTARAAADRRARIDARIRTERHTGRRAAWRAIRDDELEQL